MPNKFKYNKTGTETDSIFKGNWAIDTTAPNSGGGPSSTTGLYNGAAIPSGGYTIYSPGSVYTATTDDELLGKVRDLGGDYSSVSAAITWAASEPSVIILNKSFDNIVTDGLVLNLDASNISSFVDSEPTVNLVSNWNLDTGWSKGYQRDIVFDEIEPPMGVDAPTVGFNRGTSSAYWYSYGNYTPQIPGETYTVSIYVKTNDPSFSIRFYTADNNEVGRIWGGSIGVPNDGEWHRVVWPSFVNPSNSQSDSLSFNMGMSGQYGEAPENRTWLCAPQFQQGTEVTPFVAGTRLQNTTLYDLSGNDNNGTLTNGPTFNPSEWIDFDGTDDEIVVADDSTLDLTTEMSFEFLFRASSSQNNLYPRLIDKSSWLVHMSQTSPFGIYQNVNTSVGLRQTGTTSTIIQADTWTHVISNYDGQIGKIYINGNLVRTIDFGSVLPCTVNGTVVTIGGNTGTDRQLNGSIAKTKIYNKALSESEVSQNYYQGPIVTNGLVFAVDAGNLVSYESGSTTTYSLTGSMTGSLQNGTGYLPNSGGTWDFDGTDDHINIGNPTALQSLTTGTIEAVYYRDASTSTYQMIFTDSVSALEITYSGNALQFYIGNSGISVTHAVVGEFFHVAGVWGSGYKKLYLNGSEVASGTNTGINTGSLTRYIGGRGASYPFNGKIPLVRVYTAALTAAQVTQNFNAQRNRFGI